MDGGVGGFARAEEHLEAIKHSCMALSFSNFDES